MLVSGRPRALHENIIREHHENTTWRRPRGGLSGATIGLGRARSQMRHVPLARAGLMPRKRRLLDVNEIRNPHDGRMVDALALAAEEGRGHAAKCPGEALAA